MQAAIERKFAPAQPVASQESPRPGRALDPAGRPAMERWSSPENPAAAGPRVRAHVRSLPDPPRRGPRELPGL